MATPSSQARASRSYQETENAPHIVGKHSQFTGEIRHAGRVEVWGSVRGRIIATQVSVKQGGEIDGHVAANHVRNDGTIVGEIRTKRLELSYRSVIGGDIQFEFLGVEPGCVFQPRTAMMSLTPEMLPELNAENISQEIDNPRPRLHRQPGPRLAIPISTDLAPRAIPRSPPRDEFNRPDIRDVRPGPQDDVDAPRPFLVPS